MLRSVETFWIAASIAEMADVAETSMEPTLPPRDSVVTVIWSLSFAPTWNETVLALPSRSLMPLKLVVVPMRSI